MSSLYGSMPYMGIHKLRENVETQGTEPMFAII